MLKLDVREIFKTFQISLRTGAAVGAFLIPANAIAQNASSDDQPVTVAAVDPDDAIIVTGLRASLEDALNIRRNADVILDGISADDIGSTPDLNLGEALQRIPGVQINREAGRRDATISVRGLPGRFTQTTVQGQSIASTTRGGNTGNPFGIFDSSIFNGANVIKSFTADTPSGGLAAQVDLRIRSALERRELFVARAELQWEETTGDYNPGFFLSGTKRIGDRFGIYGTVAWSEQSFRRDTFQINTYEAFSNADLANFTSGARASGLGDTILVGPDPVPNANFDIAAVGANGLPNSVVFARQTRQNVDISRGDRLSAAGGVAYELTDDLVFRFDGLYTRRDLDETLTNLLVIDAPTNGRTLVTPLSAPVEVGVADFDDNQQVENVFVVPRVLLSDQRTNFSTRAQPGLDQVWALYPQINFENDDWRFDIIGTYSEAIGRDIQGQFDRTISENGNNSSPAPDTDRDGLDDAAPADQFAIIDTGLGNFDNILVDVNLPANINDLSQVTGIRATNSTNAGFNIPGAFNPFGNAINTNANFGLFGFFDDVKRDRFSLDFDLARKFSGSIITEVGIGGFYSNENSVRRRVENSNAGLNFPAITTDAFIVSPGLTEGAEFAGGRIPGFESEEFFAFDLDLYLQQIGIASRDPVPGFERIRTTNNRVLDFPELTAESAATVTPDEAQQAAEFVPGGRFLQARFPLNRTIDDNFTSSRETIELYAITKFDLLEVSDVPLRGNVGGRFVTTDLVGQVLPVAAQFFQNLAAVREANGGPALEFRPGAELAFDEASNSFQRFLPSVNLIYEITPDVAIRAAYYHTFEAIDLAEFSPTPTFIRESQPGDEFGDEDPGDENGDQLVGSDGQPIPRTTVGVSALGVQPRRSIGFDFGVSWYNRPGSVISLGFFRKSLIGDISRQRNFCPVGEDVTVLGRTFENLRFADINSDNDIEVAFSGNCIFTNDIGDPQRIRIDQTVNNPDTINVTGFEAQIQQNLDFLPGLLSNTGFVVNYTRVRSGGDNNVELFNVAGDTYNLIGYYEDKLLQARLAWNNQSSIQLQGQGTFSGGARVVQPRGQLDFSGAIRPLPKFEVRFEVFNITQSSRRETLGFDELLRQFDYDGRTVAISTTLRF